MRETPDVILLRSADDPDPYVAAFENEGRRAVCEPVLSFTFPNPSALCERLVRADRYGGLIATSPRVGIALDRVISDRPELVESWQAKVAYAVGPKTAERLREVGLPPLGAEAGDAAALADRIVDEAPEAPLLFLCGNRRRDTLPNRLQAAAVPFDELVVYETHTRKYLDLPRAGGGTWLAFFSPSGLEAVQEAPSVDPERYRIAAIGPTTGGALEEAGLSVEAVATEPSPKGLVAAITDTEVSN